MLSTIESGAFQLRSARGPRRRFLGAPSEPRVLGQLVEKYLRALNELGVCNRGRLNEPHFFLNFTHRLLGNGASVVGPSCQIPLHLLRIGGKLLGPRANRNQFLLHRLVENFLAVDAAPTSGAALYGDMVDRCLRAEGFVQVIDVADFRRSRIRAPDALRVRHCWFELLPDRSWILEQIDGVAE